MQRRRFLKGLAAASGAISAPALYGAQANRPAPQLLAQDAAQSRPPDDPWPGKKRILAIADPQEWYASPGYHHDSASHTLATVERLGRESGAWITVIRTDMHLLTKQPIAGYNVRNLNHFDAVFYMGEGPWNITDQQKADLLSFVHEDGKGFIAGHAGNGGHLLLWPEYAEMIGGNLVGEFPSADMHIVVEDPNFPGVQGFPKEFTFRDQYTIVGPNYSRDVDHVIMRMNRKNFPKCLPRCSRNRIQIATRRQNSFKPISRSWPPCARTETIPSCGARSMARAACGTRPSAIWKQRWMMRASSRCTLEPSSGPWA
jgi:uncharacterized protein